MKKNLIKFMLAFICTFTFSIFASGCFDSPTDNTIKIDNSNDLIKVQNVNEDEPQYYTSKYLSFITEINGSYTTNRQFTLDSNNTNKRIYDNIYFYKYDFFQMMSNDYKYIWCSLSDENDIEYIDVEREQGEDIQANIKKTGIYKITFDTNTFLFDIEYKSEIDTPVYEEIKNCDVYTTTTKWITMEKDGDEFYINNLHLERAKLASFFSSFSHTSNYKTTIENTCLNKYIYKNGSKPSSDIYFMIGGTYNIYLNAKTYIVRVELVSADNDGYTARVYENSTPIDLQPENENYIFKYEYNATSDVGGYGVVSDNVPKIYNKSNIQYNLTATESSMNYISNNAKDYYFKTRGTYNITINLLNFTISVEKETI